jgi:hypothetical protein
MVDLHRQLEPLVDMSKTATKLPEAGKQYSSAEFSIGFACRPIDLACELRRFDRIALTLLYFPNDHEHRFSQGRARYEAGARERRDQALLVTQEPKEGDRSSTLLRPFHDISSPG